MAPEVFEGKIQELAKNFCSVLYSHYLIQPVLELFFFSDDFNSKTELFIFSLFACFSLIDFS